VQIFLFLLPPRVRPISTGLRKEMFSSTSFVLLLSFASFTIAKTDLSGCTSSDVIANGGASIIWYVPGSGELCNFLDCGGGTAPPKTDVPGCPLYSGAAAYTPSFLSGYGPGATYTPTRATPTTVILTDSSLPAPSSTFVTATSTHTTAVGTQTTTLGQGGNGTTSAPTLVTTALIYDTSAATEPVTNMITPTSPASSQATTNAAVVGSKAKKEVVMAAIGAVAGFALL